MPAGDSLSLGALPIGLAHGIKLTRAVSAGEVVTRDDVDLEEEDPTVRTRREMERAFARDAMGPVDAGG
jgi:predicted homoserine dehydrogenase-like protein